jgi:predicted ATP-dependent serine protease
MNYLPEDHVPHSKSCRELYAQTMEELALPSPSVKLKSFPTFDMMTNGFRPREFTILCGATGVGKTCLLANFSAALIKNREPHFVASVETGATDFIRRVISVYEAKDYNHGNPVSVDDLKKIHITHGGALQSDTLQLSLYDNRFSVETLMADILWHVKNTGCKIAMIDNLNFFMEVTSAANQVIEMDRVIHELVIFCKQVDVHVIMVMHPKKTDSGRVDSEFDIKGSSTAVQEAHNILLFNRPHPDLLKSEIAMSGDRELKIQKMRRIGKYVGKRILLKCKDSTTYSEGSIV